MPLIYSLRSSSSSSTKISSSLPLPPIAVAAAATAPAPGLEGEVEEDWLLALLLLRLSVVLLPPGFVCMPALFKGL